MSVGPHDSFEVRLFFVLMLLLASVHPIDWATWVGGYDVPMGPPSQFARFVCMVEYVRRWIKVVALASLAAVAPTLPMYGIKFAALCFSLSIGAAAMSGVRTGYVSRRELVRMQSLHLFVMFAVVFRCFRDAKDAEASVYDDDARVDFMCNIIMITCALMDASFAALSLAITSRGFILFGEHRIGAARTE